MSKPLFKDMIPVRNHHIEEKKEVRKAMERTQIKEKRENRATMEIGVNNHKRKSRYMLWFVALVSVVFCFFALSFLFSKAEVLVNPKTADIVLNENLFANKDSNANDLPFDLVVISGEESKILQASGEKDVSQKATGVVVIYNAFSTSSQPLSVDTRLEGSNGKIYKTQVKTVVPGIGKNGTPGSVEVKIYGSVAGADYNSAPLDFKIFGFKGTPKYSKIYGRSKGAITGGFVGKAPAISDADKTSTSSGLKTALQSKLLRKATDQIPSGFVLFKNAIFLNTDDSNISSTYNKDNSMTLTRSGTLYGILFNEQKLTRKIAGNNIDKYDGSEVYISNIKNLTFSLGGKDDISFENVKSISFNLSGPAKIVWKLDVNKFIADLLGRSKKDFNQILAQYPNVNSAILTVSPVWKMSIPNNSKDIKIIVNYPK